MLMLKREVNMNVLKLLLQPCYAVMLAVLFSPSIYSADRYNYINSENSKSSIESNAFPFYLKLSTGVTGIGDYVSGIGLGYISAPHRMELRLGLLRDYIGWANSIQGHYYYNIFDGNKASIFITGGLISDIRRSRDTGVALGVGLTTNLVKDRMYLDIECSTMAPSRPLLVSIHASVRFHY
ncbi:putative ompA-like autotransporter [Orientia tsutsugamushi str. Boryong]|uniref:Putative ompA-like autotransporter n=2 Tax=Orientia tsutsugamushi TaxID=784 RepID=A5CFD0_ORITB|nr:putative ompA-like autotransporter [Orientia tsutsugamushi str. Boryong]